MTTCQYVKRDGSVCDKRFRAGFDACSRHRPRTTPALPYAACSSCGVPTRRIVEGAPLCALRGCGWNEYCRTYRRAKRAQPKLMEKVLADAVIQEEVLATKENIIREAEAAAVAAEEEAIEIEAALIAKIVIARAAKAAATAKLVSIRAVAHGEVAVEG